MLKITFFLVAIVLLPVYGVPCSCVPGWPRPIAEEIENYQLIVSGTVEAFRSESSEELEVRFKVERCYKGRASGKTLIYTHPIESMCGYPFEKKKKYLVFAYKNNGKLRTNYCTRTQLFSEASEDLKFLENWKKAQKE
jgi:hypothetical protein